MPKFTAIAQRLQWVGEDRLVERFDDGREVTWFSPAEGSGFRRVQFSPREPFQLAIAGKKRVHRFDLFRGEPIEDLPTGYRGRTVALAGGHLFVPFRRRHDPEQGVQFRPAGGGDRIELELDRDQTVGWVLDEQRVAVVSNSRFVCMTRGMGADVHGWVDPLSGERGTFPWLEHGCRNLVLQLCRGRSARELLLVVGRDGGERRSELIWDDGGDVSRVPLGGLATINYWEGGDSAIVSDAHRIYRIWRDGRKDVLFAIGVKP